jgi:hypothetical protein
MVFNEMGVKKMSASFKYIETKRRQDFINVPARHGRTA